MYNFLMNACEWRARLGIEVKYKEKNQTVIIETIIKGNPTTGSYREEWDVRLALSEHEFNNDFVDLVAEQLNTSAENISIIQVVSIEELYKIEE